MDSSHVSYSPRQQKSVPKQAGINQHQNSRASTATNSSQGSRHQDASTPICLLSPTTAGCQCPSHTLQATTEADCGKGFQHRDAPYHQPQQRASVGTLGTEMPIVVLLLLLVVRAIIRLSVVSWYHPSLSCFMLSSGCQSF